MKFSNKLIQLRKEKGFSQEDLANSIGVSRQSVSKWESDQSMPDLPKLIQLSEIFHVSIDYLVKESITQRNPEKNSVSPENSGQTRTADSSGEVLHRLDRIENTINKNMAAPGKEYEYISKTKIGRLPLVHIHYRSWASGTISPFFMNLGYQTRFMAIRGDYSVKAKGIIAIGNNATGLISIGLWAKGLISLGLISVGGLALGVFSLGLLAMGIICAGLAAVGIIAFGILAMGISVIGIYTSGVASLGKEVAVGVSSSGHVSVGTQEAKGTYTLLTDAATTKEAVWDFILQHKPGIPRWILKILTSGI